LQKKLLEVKVAEETVGDLSSKRKCRRSKLLKKLLGVEVAEEIAKVRVAEVVGVEVAREVVGRKAHQGGRIDLVLEESLTRVLGLGIRHLKLYKKRRVLVGFPLKRRGFGPGL